MTSDFRLGMSEKVSKYRTLKENLEGFKSFWLKPTWISHWRVNFSKSKTIGIYFNFAAKNNYYLCMFKFKFAHKKPINLKTFVSLHNKVFFIANTTKLGWRSKLENQTIYLESSIKAKIMSKLWTLKPSKTCQMAKHN